MVFLFRFGSFIRQQIKSLLRQSQKFLAPNLQMMGLHRGGIDFIGDQLEPHLLTLIRLGSFVKRLLSVPGANTCGSTPWDFLRHSRM
jgi:hypothetical protein